MSSAERRLYYEPMTREARAELAAEPVTPEAGASTEREHHRLEKAAFDATYDRWFSRAAGWSLQNGFTGREAEFIVATALEAFFRENPPAGSCDETALAVRLLAHLRGARGLLADRTAGRRPAAIPSSRGLRAAAGSRG